MFKKIEILASYFSLGKIPQKKRSLLSKINLAILCKPIYIEKYGLGKLFASLLDVIKKLKLDVITMQVDNHNVAFRGTISVTVANNLAKHRLGEYFESFSPTHRFCRYCMCHHNNLQNCLNDVSAEKWTILACNTIINEIKPNDDLKFIYGLKQKSDFITTTFWYFSWQFWRCGSWRHQ